MQTSSQYILLELYKGRHHLFQFLFFLGLLSQVSFHRILCKGLLLVLYSWVAKKTEQFLSFWVAFCYMLIPSCFSSQRPSMGQFKGNKSCIWLLFLCSFVHKCTYFLIGLQRMTLHIRLDFLCLLPWLDFWPIAIRMIPCCLSSLLNFAQHDNHTNDIHVT